MDKYFKWGWLKSKLTPKNIEQLVLPMTVSSWIVGMGIIEIPLGNRWPILSCTYALMLSIGYGLMTKKTISNLDAMVSVPSVSGRFVVMTLFYGNIGLNVCGMILGWLRMRRVKKLIITIEKSEKILETMGISPNYGKIYLRVLFALFTQGIAVLFFIVSAYMWPTLKQISDWEKVIGAVTMYYPVILISVGDITFITFVRFIGLRFAQLNDFLKGLSLSNDLPQHARVLRYLRSKYEGRDGEPLEKLTNDDTNAMKAARKYHYELTKIGYMINDAYGIQALLSLTVAFVLITGLLYRTFDIILWSSLNRAIIEEELANAVCWLLFYSIRVAFVNAECASTSSSASTTGQIICHLHEPSTNQAFREEIRDFTLQLTQHSLTFTACGFFTLNHNFIHGMIGSISTYLVILIQIGETPKDETFANTTTLAP